MQQAQNMPLSCRYRVFLHGPFEVWKRETSDTWHLIEKEAWGRGRPTRTIFKHLLATPGRRLSRVKLQEDLWSESDFELADKYLNNTISVLYRVLGKDLLKSWEATYELAGQDLIWTDIDACEALLKEVENRGCTSIQALPLLEEALSYLERGNFLEGEGSTWVYGLQKKSENLLKQCRLWLAEHYETQGKLLQAGLQYRAMLQTMPPDEEALCAWIAMLIRHEKRQEALTCYQDTKAMWERQEFPISPTITTLAAQLEEQISPVLPSLTQHPQSIINGKTNGLEDQDMHVMLRRQVLQQILGIISLPHALPFFPISFKKATASTEEYLVQCEENISACWRLMKGSELDVVQSVLCTWLPPLEHIIRQSDVYRQRSAALAVQGYIIAGIVTVLQKDHEGAEWCCKQAVEYSDLAEDPNLKVAALKHLATKYHSAKYLLKTLHTYQEALTSVEHVSPLLQSRIYLGLALAYAQCGKKNEAFQYWNLTQQHFPAQPEDDPSFLYADCGRSSLNHYGGLMYLAFEQAHKAWEIFEEVVQMQQQIVIPERTIIEIVNCKAEAAIAQKNLDLTCIHLQEGIQGAFKLRSKQRFHDTHVLYKQACTIWPHEQSLLKMEELFH